MLNERTILELGTWDRLNTPRLLVSAELLGSVHLFTFQSHAITVRLPPPSEALRDESDRFQLFSYRNIDNKKEPIAYLIHSVDVCVAMSAPHDLPSAILQTPPKAPELLSSQEIASLDRIAANGHALAMQAFDLWIRTFRWQTGQPFLGRDDPEGAETGWSTYVTDTTSGKNIWMSTKTMFVRSGEALSVEAWGNIGHVLASQKTPPISVDLFFDAVVHLDRGDIKRVVIDAAVSAETYLRSVVQVSLPFGCGPEVRRFVDEANIRAVLTKLFPEALVTTGRAPLKIRSELHELFDARNKILHKGVAYGLTADKCKKYLSAVQELITEDLRPENRPRLV